MIRVPALAGGSSSVSFPGTGVLLLSDGAFRLVRGKAYEQVVPLIDGRRSSDEIVASAVNAGLDATVVWYALLKLEAAGHLTESAPGIPADVAAFWSGLGIAPAEALSSIRAARVRVCSVGSSDVERFRLMLERCGACPVDSDTVGDFDVVLARDYLDAALLPFDAAARAARRRWLLVRPAGYEIWIGPLFEPGKTGCLHCLRHKLERSTAVHRFAARLNPESAANVRLPTIGVTQEVAYGLAAVEVVKALAGARPDLTGGMLTLDLRDGSSTIHRLLRRPDCPECGDPSIGRGAPLRLDANQLVRFDADGGYRSLPPESTCERYGHVVSPITGIVPSLDAVPAPPGVGHVFVANDHRRVLDESTFLTGRFDSVGKGMTEAQARASVIGEAIERYSSELQGTERRIRGSIREMGADAIHPNKVMNYSERQYREREFWNASDSGRHFVPEPLGREARVDWTPLWSLTHDRRRLLPTELLFRDPHRSGPPRYCVSCSNGCASGNTLEEAVLQGFLEVIERDAAAMWWYNRLRLPAIDLSSFDDEWLSDVASRYDELGRDLVVIDLTNDLGIPVFVCVSHMRGNAKERILLGLGCHVEARIALQRSVSEACQMLVVDLGLRDEWSRDPDYVAWSESATRANQPQLVPREAVPRRTSADFPRLPSGGALTDSVEHCRRAVESRGLEVLVLDQTRPDTGMPVVKVVVPGLRHMWTRFGPGRLYDVPVAAGLLESPLAESDLNPVPFFF